MEIWCFCYILQFNLLTDALFYTWSTKIYKKKRPILISKLYYWEQSNRVYNTRIVLNPSLIETQEAWKHLFFTFGIIMNGHFIYLVSLIYYLNMFSKYIFLFKFSCFCTISLLVIWEIDCIIRYLELFILIH